MINKLKKILKSSQYLYDELRHPKSIKVDWYGGDNNFGDILNPLLIQYLTKKKVINVRSEYCDKAHMLAIGSILDRATSSSIVWGSGYISESSIYIEKPKKIYAVRGPKTRDKLLEQGVECPEVFGDPALLMPSFYCPELTKKYSIGILPHYVDKKNKWLDSLPEDVKIIDVQNPNPLKVIDQMLECEMIASSSLHGIIISDAYKIPSVWIQLSENVKGGAFKFEDYFLSVGREVKTPFIIKEKSTIIDLMHVAELHKIKINLGKLLDQFPYE
jgi:pyruvyltransferase